MNCPHLKALPCDPECIFRTGDKCLQAEYYKAYIMSSEQAMAMFKQIFPILASLPPEVREQFPEELRKQIEDMLEQQEGG